jgi:RNA polymerase sigma-70 factor (ECF subfamily)
MAAMVVLDKLTPEQRVSFVLHDAFSVPFGEIADILGCTPTRPASTAPGDAARSPTRTRRPGRQWPSSRQCSSGSSRRS